MSADDYSGVDLSTPGLDQTDEAPRSRRGFGIWAVLAVVVLLAIVLLLLLTQCVPRVPDVLGLSQKAATAKLEDSGYELGNVSKIELANTPAGRVAEQAPTGGVVFARGRNVDLVVALGADEVTVPDVIGYDTPAAQLLITGQQLIMEITGAYSDTVAAGAIISQNPPAGAEVRVGTTVMVVVSLGSPPESEAGSGTASGNGNSAPFGGGGTGSTSAPRDNCTAVYKGASVWASGGDIYIRLTPGAGARRLTSGSSWDTGPLLAPSGKYVVFLRAPRSGNKPTSVGRVCLTTFDASVLQLPVSSLTSPSKVHYGTPVFAPSPTGTAPDSDWLVTPQYWPEGPEPSSFSARLLVTNVPMDSTWVSWNIAYRPTPGLKLSRSTKPGNVKVTQVGTTGTWAVRNFGVYTGIYSKP